MHPNTTHAAPGGVNPEELDRHIAEMYRDVANEARRDLHFPTGRPLAEALGYPAELLDRRPAQAVNSFAGVGHRFASERAQRTSDKYGAHSVSLLALKPTETTTTEEVSQ